MEPLDLSTVDTTHLAAALRPQEESAARRLAQAAMECVRRRKYLEDPEWVLIVEDRGQALPSKWRNRCCVPYRGLAFRQHIADVEHVAMEARVDPAQLRDLVDRLEAWEQGVEVRMRRNVMGRMSSSYGCGRTTGRRTPKR